MKLLSTISLTFRSCISSHAFPIISPFIIFMIFLSFEGFFSDQAVYFIYPLKTIFVGAVLFMLRKRLPSFAISNFFVASMCGVVVFLLWVGLFPVLSTSFSTSGGFNPTQFESPLLQFGLIFFRILGAAVMVPILEELFWRAYLMRFLIDADFAAVPLGKYTHFSFWVTTIMFASVHGSQWPLALLAGIIYGALFVRTKNLGNVILAHAITNLMLGVYVVITQSWYFW